LFGDCLAGFFVCDPFDFSDDFGHFFGIEGFWGVGPFVLDGSGGADDEFAGDTNDDLLGDNVICHFFGFGDGFFANFYDLCYVADGTGGHAGGFLANFGGADYFEFFAGVGEEDFDEVCADIESKKIIVARIGGFCGHGYSIA